MPKPVLKIYDDNGVEIPIPAIVGKRGPTGPAGPNSVSTSTDSSITGLLKGDTGKVAQALPGTDYATPEDLHEHSNKSDLDLVSGTNTGDQNASAVPYTPSTHVSSTDVQAAITEVGNEVGDAAAVLAAINGDGVVVPTETLISNHNAASDAHTILARKTETMRLLISRTIGAGENVSAITWTQDYAGNALALIDMDLRIRIPSNPVAVGTTGSVSLRLNGITSADSYIANTSKSAYTVANYYRTNYGNSIAKLENVGGYMLGTVYYIRDDGTTFGGGNHPIGTLFSVANISQINIFINNITYFPAGTTIAIYGRTA